MRTAIVFSGGGARGAYEAGVLSHLLEHVYPQLGPGFEFDVVSGTSVGAIHAAYLAASAHQSRAERSERMVETWRSMAVGDVLQLTPLDLAGIPLRMLGVSGLSRRRRAGARVMGGLVDIAPLERIVAERIPWADLPGNLAARRPAALCVTCTEVRTGRTTTFLNGPLANPDPWSYDPNSQALKSPITATHVRASAAIPFLFPAVRVEDRYYVDGGLRQNTPLAPALRLRADRLVVIALKHRPRDEALAQTVPENAITKPAFLLGKVLDALLLDQLEVDLHRLELVNAILEQGEAAYGPQFRDRINVAVREHRGVGFRRVDLVTLRPSEDLGRIAAECYRHSGGAGNLGLLPALVTRFARMGVPGDEADLLSYLFFDRCYTQCLVELGRQDARAQEGALLELLGGAGSSGDQEPELEAAESR